MKEKEIIEIEKALDQLAVSRQKLEDLQAKKSQKINEVMREIQPKIKEIDEDFADTENSLRSDVETLEKEIREATISSAVSVKGKFLHSVYNKGRITWDTKGLEGFAKAYPEVKDFKKEGAPFITIRPIDIGSTKWPA